MRTQDTTPELHKAGLVQVPKPKKKAKAKKEKKA
jgi:hypothetical protein